MEVDTTKTVLAFIDRYGNMVIFLMLLATGFITGTIAEKRHYRSIVRREKEMVGLPVVTLNKLGEDEARVENVFFVSGCCVISQDYFKLVLAGIKTIFGGRLTSFETLVDRGRREAILRMKESAKKAGCDLVMNARLEMSSIGNKQGKGIGCVEVMAYGTGIKYAK
ncbi:MAG: YbjQ family protein [Spirochaetia bacterium]|nr:YbjQ family protein [Spirochaetia bacterium]